MPNAASYLEKLYLGFLFFSAGALIYYLIHITQWQEIYWPAVVLFLILNVLSDSYPIKMADGMFLSVSFAITFATILLFQPLIVVIICILGDLLSLGKGRTPAKYLFNSTQLTISSGLAALAYISILRDGKELSEQFFLAAFIALLICFLLNCIFMTIIISLNQKEEPFKVWLTNIKWIVPGFLGMAPLGIIFALIHAYIGLWGLVMFIIPLTVARQAFVSYVNMRETFLDTIRSLSVAIDAKDHYTKGHSARVADIAVALARKLKWPADKIELFRYIALIHDVGKIAVPEDILNKEGSLTSEEYNQMKHHAAAGYEMIKDIKFFAEESGAIKHHHERWDGSGYPEGLKGELIPAGARLLLVADAYDAMTSNRPYRKALSPLTALQELLAGSGSQFDPRMVETFVSIFPEISANRQPHGPEIIYGELAAAARETELKL